MRERIKMIMDAENMSPARFADSLDIGRAVISHILNGRNNPSLDVVTRILKQLPQISSDWLLTGKGSMYVNSIDDKSKLNSPDLFNQILSENITKNTNNTRETKYPKENIVNLQENKIQNTEKEVTKEKIITTKKIKQIIIYYTDNTFETFSGDK